MGRDVRAVLHRRTRLQLTKNAQPLDRKLHRGPGSRHACTLAGSLVITASQGPHVSLEKWVVCDQKRRNDRPGHVKWVVLHHNRANDEIGKRWLDPAGTLSPRPGRGTRAADVAEKSSEPMPATVH